MSNNSIPSATLGPPPIITSSTSTESVKSSIGADNMYPLQTAYNPTNGCISGVIVVNETHWYNSGWFIALMFFIIMVLILLLFYFIMMQFAKQVNADLTARIRQAEVVGGQLITDTEKAANTLLGPTLAKIDKVLGSL